MHVGTNMHNSFHTLWWQMEPAHTGFLPAVWRDGNRDDRDGRPYRYLWLLSRGPMSHGCTHVNAGHIAELRQLLPAETERLYDVDVFYNQSQLYDVFDIDGDLTPEVMGVRYFIAYSLRDKTPDQLRSDLASLKKEQFNLRFQKASGQLENTVRARQVRRDVARVLTFLNQKTRSAS